MTIEIIAVGKLKESFWKEACGEYLKRLKAYASVTIREIADIDPDRGGGWEKARDKEGEAILAAIPEKTHVILMAIRGRERSSEDFSNHLEDLKLSGKSSLCFVIGGSNGVSSAVEKRADEKLSFGPVTLPHNLARVVLLEQIYRAFKIARGEPYHK